MTHLLIMLLLIGRVGIFQAQSQKPNNIPKCALTRAQAPKLRGLSFGMTQPQILARFPGVKLTDFLNIYDKVGVTQVRIRFVNNLKQQSKGTVEWWTEVRKSSFPNFNDVDSLDISFLDKRVYEISVTYDDTIDWENTSEFVSRVSDALGLPTAAWEERKDDRQIQDLDCKGFRLIAWVKTYPKREAYLFLADKVAEEVIAKRERKQKRTFKP